MKKLIILLCALLMACSSIRIENVNQAENFALSKYKTFDFFEVDASGDGIGSD